MAITMQAGTHTIPQMINTIAVTSPSSFRAAALLAISLAMKKPKTIKANESRAANPARDHQGGPRPPEL